MHDHVGGESEYPTHATTSEMEGAALIEGPDDSHTYGNTSLTTTGRWGVYGYYSHVLFHFGLRLSYGYFPGCSGGYVPPSCATNSHGLHRQPFSVTVYIFTELGCYW